MEVKDMLNENLHAMLFCHLTLEDEVTNHSVLSCFRSELNTFIIKQRSKVKRTFVSMKRWFGSGMYRDASIAKTYPQPMLEAIAHNVKASPGLVVVRQRCV